MIILIMIMIIIMMITIIMILIIIMILLLLLLIIIIVRQGWPRSSSPRSAPAAGRGRPFGPARSAARPTSRGPSARLRSVTVRQQILLLLLLLLLMLMLMLMLMLLLGSRGRTGARARAGWHCLSNATCLIRPHMFSAA